MGLLHKVQEEKAYGDGHVCPSNYMVNLRTAGRILMKFHMDNIQLEYIQNLHFIISYNH
jgi:hypothetical protein